MGTDIHVNVLHRQSDGSYKILNVYDENGNEITYRMRFNDRNYALFGKLAGVRSWEDPIVEPRGLFYGLPADVVEHYDNADYGYHTPTWFDYVELQALSRTPDAMSHYDDEDDDDPGVNILGRFVDDIGFLLNMFNIWYPKPGEVIVSVWFDS